MKAIPPIHHLVSNEGAPFRYMSFEGLGHFHSFVDKQAKNLAPNNAEVWMEVVHYSIREMENGTGWFGGPAPNSIEELEKYDCFHDVNLLEKVRPQVKKYLDRYMGLAGNEALPRPKASYNDRGLGMFSFDRAAMGLYQNYDIVMAPPIDKTATQLNLALGCPRYSTSVKKSYAYFEHRPASHPCLRLFLLAGANANIKGESLLYTGLACAELVEFLELRGVAVEVNFLLGTFLDEKALMAVVRLKRFEDRARKNQLLLPTSPRYFRYRGFKALIAMADKMKWTMPSSLGSLKDGMGKGFVQKYCPQGVVFEQSYSLEQAKEEVKQVIENVQKQIKNQ